MVKYLFLFAGFASQALAYTDNERSHILQCRAQRDSLPRETVENTPVSPTVSKVPELIEQPLTRQDSAPEQVQPKAEEVVINLVNPTLEERIKLNEPAFPSVKDSVFDASTVTEASSVSSTQSSESIEVSYEYKFHDGLLRPQLEALTNSFFPEFSISWDKYHIPYRWQGEFLLTGKDRWALLNRVVESFGISVTVNGNFVMEFSAMEEK